MFKINKNITKNIEMTQEQIETKCQDYSKSATPSFVNGTFDRYAIEQSFEDGANWRINSVWHSYEDAKKADFDKKDLVIAYHPKVNKFFIGNLFLSHYYRTNPETGVTTKIPEVALKYDRCMEVIFTEGTQWAYLKDLMPEEEYK